MDTSEKYIEMCMQALKIQKLWSPKVGDRAWREEKYLQITDACVVITDIKFSENRRDLVTKTRSITGDDHRKDSSKIYKVDFD